MRPLFVLAAAVLVLGLTMAPPRQGRLPAETFTPDPRVVRTVGHSHLSLIADLYWIRMSALATQANLPYEGAALIRWGEFVTELDPKLFWAYVMGGVLGPMKVNGEVYNGPAGAQLLEKGTRHVADFRLNIYLGYLYLELLRQPLDAARVLREGSRLPGAPPFLGALATRLLATSGQLADARAFAQEMVASSPDPEIRDAFAYRLKELDREEALRTLEAAVRTWQTQHGGQPPPTLEALVQGGVLPALPTDPLGGEWTLDASGAVGVSTGERLRVFEAAD